MLKIEKMAQAIEEMVKCSKDWCNTTVGLHAGQLAFLDEFFDFDIDLYNKRIVFHFFGEKLSGTGAKTRDMIIKSVELFGPELWRMENAGEGLLRLTKTLNYPLISKPLYIVIHKVIWDDLVLDPIYIDLTSYAS